MKKDIETVKDGFGIFRVLNETIRKVGFQF
jgi:hypothetical protein